MELPVGVVEGAGNFGLKPSGNAVEMELMTTHSNSNGAFFLHVVGNVSLAIDAGVHNKVSANSAVVKVVLCKNDRS